MKTPSNLSYTEKKKLATDLEKEKDKIVGEKVQNLHEKKISEKKQEIARAVEQEAENRKIRLLKAYKNESTIIRFIYGIKSLLQWVPPEDLYHESLLRDLCNKIRKTGRGGAVLASNDMISGEFITKLYNVYIQATELGEILRAMFKQQKSIEIYTRYAFKHLYKNIGMKRKLSDIVDLAVLRDKIQGGGEPLQEYLIEQRTVIRKHSKNINQAFTTSLLKDLNDLYFFYLFIIFDYKKFFISLGGTIASLRSGNFDDCLITVGLKAPLENFYQFVPVLSVLSSSEVARYILACGALVLRGDEDQTLENVSNTASKDEGNLMKKLMNFCRTWNTSICKYPFEDLIRLCSRNRFYEPRRIGVPSLQIKERIKKFVEQQLLFELELFVDQVREEFNANAKENLLIDYENSLLGYYYRDSEINTGRFYGIPGFRYVDEINIIYNFLTKYYAQNIKKIVIYLIRTVLPKSVPLRTVLMNQSMSLENLEERIRNFNSDLGPERPWGKSLINIVYRLEKNDTGNLVRQIRELIAEIDSEAEHLREQSQDIFDSTVNQLQAIAMTENAKLGEALNMMMPDTQRTLLVSIGNAIQAFRSIQALVRSYFS